MNTGPARKSRRLENIPGKTQKLIFPALFVPPATPPPIGPIDTNSKKSQALSEAKDLALPMEVVDGEGFQGEILSCAQNDTTCIFLPFRLQLFRARASRSRLSVFLKPRRGALSNASQAAETTYSHPATLSRPFSASRKGGPFDRPRRKSDTVILQCQVLTYSLFGLVVHVR